MAKTEPAPVAEFDRTNQPEPRVGGGLPAATPAAPDGLAMAALLERFDGIEEEIKTLRSDTTGRLENHGQLAGELGAQIQGMRRELVGIRRAVVLMGTIVGEMPASSTRSDVGHLKQALRLELDKLAEGLGPLGDDMRPIAPRREGEARPAELPPVVPLAERDPKGVYDGNGRRIL